MLWTVWSVDSVFIASDTKLILKWLQKKKYNLHHIIEKFNDSGAVGGKDSNIKSQLCLHLLFHFKLSIRRQILSSYLTQVFSSFSPDRAKVWFMGKEHGGISKFLWNCCTSLAHLNAILLPEPIPWDGVHDDLIGQLWVPHDYIWSQSRPFDSHGLGMEEGDLHIWKEWWKQPLKTIMDSSQQRVFITSRGTHL